MVTICMVLIIEAPAYHDREFVVINAVLLQSKAVPIALNRHDVRTAGKAVRGGGGNPSLSSGL